MLKRNSSQDIESETSMKKTKVDSGDEPEKKNEMPVNECLYVVHGMNKYRFDVKNIILSTPKKQRMGSKSEVTYRIRYMNGTTRDVPLVLQTPTLFSRFGFSQYKFDKDDANAKTKLSIEATFKDEESSVLATFRALDAKLLQLAKEMASSFLPKKKANPDLIELMYTPMVKMTEKDGVTYSPYIRFKIQSFEQDGVISANVKCFTADSEKDDFKEIEVTELSEGCEFRAYATFEGIYVSPKALCPIVRAEQLQKTGDGPSNGYNFHDGVVTEQKPAHSARTKQFARIRKWTDGEVRKPVCKAGRKWMRQSPYLDIIVPPKNPPSCWTGSAAE